MDAISPPTPPGEFIVYVNGKKQIFDKFGVDPRTTLIQHLRSAGLTGTKLGCAEGGCGACTVMISSFDARSKEITHISANACLTPLCSVSGCHVTTVEGIGSIRNGLHPVQQRMAELHGSQCGFCTPGIVMAIYTIFRTNPGATPHEIEESLDGNLCRCTGYRPILDAAKSLSNAKGAGAGSCCRGSNGSASACPCAAAAAPGTANAGDSDKDLVQISTESTVHALPGVAAALAQKARTEPIFPPALMKFTATELLLTCEGFNWFQPVDMPSLLRYKREHPEARLVVGNSEVGIEIKFKGLEYRHIVNPVHVPELKVLACETGGVRVGAAVSLNVFRAFAMSSAAAAPAAERFRFRGLLAMADMLAWFASNHIRNTACLGGNIVTASPISDMNPMLMACNAILRIVDSSADGVVSTRDLPITSFFKGYRKVDLLPSEVLQDILIPYTQALEFVVPVKQAKRREDDISIVTAGIRVRLSPSHAVESCSLSFGGMAPTTVSAVKTMAFLQGKQWTEEVVTQAAREITKELTLPLEVPGGQAAFRVTLAASFLYRAYVRICADVPALAGQIAAEDVSAGNGFVTSSKELSRGEQSYYKREGGMTKSDHGPDGGEALKRGPVGDSIPHKSAGLQCSGEAKYTGDIPSPAGTCFGALVVSSKAHALIKSVDADKARSAPGFVAFFDHRDILGQNACGPIHADEQVFASERVQHVGQVRLCYYYYSFCCCYYYGSTSPT
jgi:xanthine dehydrogenase/oxidase